MYASPKTLRRQQTRNDAPRRRSRPSRAPKPCSEAEWNAACEFHVGRILAQADAGHYEAAGRHAGALVHMAVTRRAMEVMNLLDLRSLWKAMAIAKHELFDVNIEVSEPRLSALIAPLAAVDDRQRA